MADVEFKDTIDVEFRDTIDVEFEGSSSTTTTSSTTTSTTTSTEPGQTTVSTTTSTSSTTTTSSTASTSSTTTSSSTTSSSTTSSSTTSTTATTSSSTTTSSFSTSSTTSSTFTTTSSASTTSSSSTTTTTTPGIYLGNLQDDFDDGSIDSSKWETTVQSGCTIREEFGHIEMKGSGGNYVELRSRDEDEYNFTGSYAYFELRNFPEDANNNYFQFRVTSKSDPQVYCQIQISDYATRELNVTLVDYYLGTPQAILDMTINYDPVAHKWLRIRRSGNTVYFEGSGNGNYWQEIASEDLNSPSLFIYVGTSLRYYGF